MNEPPLSLGRTSAAKCCAIIVLFASLVASSQSHSAEIDDSLQALRAQLDQARLYVGNYPAGNNDPNPVRRRFLGLGADDKPDGSQVRALQLEAIVEKAVALSDADLTPDQLEKESAITNESIQLSLQGWLIGGNISLMEGLRITYPQGGDQQRPVYRPIPFGSPENKYNFVACKDASTAKLFYDEGLRVLLRSMMRAHPDPDGRRLIDVDVQDLPEGVRDLPGAFANKLFPQYTYYVDRGIGGDTTAARVVPIQTQGYMMGNLLQKQGQALSSIGYRLWTAAYFAKAVQSSPNLGPQMLDEAVEQLHGGANTQFLASVALAATVSDKADKTAESPYSIDRLHFARTNIEDARSIIGQIRAKQKPTLPIDEIMAGDDQVLAVMRELQDPDGGPGSLTRAQTTYLAARDALFKVQQKEQQVFQDEQTKRVEFLDQLEQLTGIKVQKEPNIDTAAGQARYRQSVVERLQAVLSDPNPGFSDIHNRLDEAIKQVVFQRQEVLLKKAALDAYPVRVKIIEDTLGGNVSAIQGAEGKITAAQLSQGIANSITITAVAGVQIGPTGGAYAGVQITNNPGAIQAANLQNDITRAANLKEMKFLQNEAAARIRNLLVDEDLAHGELESQVILLHNAEDDVTKVRGDVERLLGQLREYNTGVENLWYRDPVWNIELTGKEEEANRALDGVIRNLYKLGKMLELRWMEPFSNPVSVLSGQPQSLGPDFDNFWNLESVFMLGSVNVRDNPDLNPPFTQAQNFLKALRKWDEKLRNLRSFEGDLAVVHVSLRQDIFGLADVKTVNGATKYLETDNNSVDYAKDQSIRNSNIRRFQNMLANNGLFLPDDLNKPRGFLLRFPIRYYANGFTEYKLGNTRLFGTIPAWNYRLSKFKVMFKPLSGKNIFPQDSAQILFAQSGTVENIDFFERSLSGRSNDENRLRQINLDNYIRYDPNDLGASKGSPYLLFSIAKQSNFPDDGEVLKASTMAPRYWSPFASRWQLQVSPMNLFEIENIDDVVLELTLVSGRPDILP
ncbi:hypothetical protein [Rhizobium ruizarguesonis]|nr:hypothetical protein [Rhizobium ruizarguesonis]TBD34343.1 hypothetical protein ELH17_30625 [Rhizobium ruizarguesonis]TBD55051.1 hypothetical protein ELH16_34555 [Rhizobium ruizarguesonis]TBF01953.1 hypothetical protein ELG96_32405 [Rhizobium ruizarguesonis]